ncbi:MAG TPA: glycerol-3-phosphate 1-O-acyltransferase PlsY [Clostridiaceae bacterium]|jgi:glycerol-3-phosphate acyltransferase PlsY|nr:glycerol-3-phosphate 1-O-acyltransferase PlsY [Clostridiaceae bacterium]
MPLEIIVIVFSSIIGYLLGSVNTSIIVGKLFYKADVREYGSGNAGATNVLRTFGKTAAIAVVAGDFLKGVLACLIGRYVFGEINPGSGIFLGEYFAGFFAVIGHNWPAYFNFKGGKGVMTSFAVILMFSPISALICLGAFIVIVAVTRYVSLGSMLSAVLFLVMAFIFKEPLPMLLIGTLLVALIIIRHSANIKRLLAGNEKKLTLKNTKER